jgi:methionyl-tRNA formyltransferase
VLQRSGTVGLVLSAPKQQERPALSFRGVAGRIARKVGLRPPRLAEAAMRGQIPIYHTARGGEAALCEWLRSLRPDLICMAGFPRILPAELLEIPSIGVLNLHGSLLPRHRGLLPMFWIYYRDDRETGVTVHWASSCADAGDIVAQDSFTLPRGFPAGELARLNARRGSQLLAATLEAIERDTAVRTPQDERLATEAPAVQAGAPMVDFVNWDVERVWHFLAGLFPWFREPLGDPQLQVHQYGAVLGFDRVSHGRMPGEVVTDGGTLHLCCRDGRVQLRAASRGD